MNGKALHGDLNFNANENKPRRRASDFFTGEEVCSEDGLPVRLPEVARRMLDELQFKQTQLEIMNEELQRNQAAIEESQLRYFDFYNKAPVGFLTITRQELVAEVNERLLIWLGAPADSLLNKTLTCFIQEQDQEKYSFHIKQLFLTTVSSSFELRMLNSAGKQFWVKMETQRVQGLDGALMIRAVVSDMTERIHFEEAIRESEMKFRRLIKKIPIPLAIVNQSGEQTYINDRFIQVFGYKYQELPTLEAWRKLVHPDEKYRQWALETWNEAVDRAEKTGQDIGPIEYDITCKNGTVRTVIVSGITMEQEILMTFNDLTDRRRHEQVLKASYERRRKNDLMNELTQGGAASKQAVFESARILGTKIASPFHCFLIVLNEYQGKTRDYWQDYLDDYQFLMDSLMDVLDDENRISWESSAGIGVICFELIDLKYSKEKQKLLADQLREEIAKKVAGVDISIGIAQPAANIADLGSRFRQAETAVTAGGKVWPQLKTYHYLDMGVYQLLSCFNDDVQITEFIDRTLGKLLEYDKRKNEAFLETLEIILTSDNLKGSANKLSIHYHTLMFRKKRLEKILAVSFDEFSSRMAILTALHLLKLRQ